MSEIAEFLLARIAEDEAAARAAKDDYYARERWRLNTSRFQVPSRGARQSGEHIARHDPARVLAECEAKRRIVELHAIECYPDDEGDWYCCDGCSTPMVPHPGEVSCPTLCSLALPYADHPDCRDEWRP